MLEYSLITETIFSDTIVHAIVCIESSTLRDSGDVTAVFTVRGKEQRKLRPSVTKPSDKAQVCQSSLGRDSVGDCLKVPF